MTDHADQQPDLREASAELLREIDWHGDRRVDDDHKVLRDVRVGALRAVQRALDAAPTPAEAPPEAPEERWEAEGEGRTCEGCGEPATTADVEDVPLCADCNAAAPHADTCRCSTCAPPKAPEEHLRSLVDGWRIRSEHAHGQYRNAVEDCIADLAAVLSGGEAARQQEAEPVAWRWRVRSAPDKGWCYHGSPPHPRDDGWFEINPLFAAPPPASAAPVDTSTLAPCGIPWGIHQPGWCEVAAPPVETVGAPPEGEQPFRVVDVGDFACLTAWTGDEIEGWQLGARGTGRKIALLAAETLNRLFAVRPAAVPAPPAMSEEVREAVDELLASLRSWRESWRAGEEKWRRMDGQAADDNTPAECRTLLTWEWRAVANAYDELTAALDRTGGEAPR